MTSCRYVALLALAIANAIAPAAHAVGFVDVLDTPAQMTPFATKSPLLAVTRAGDRLIAVGQRGHIVVSTDKGASWKQSAVPVSSDLTAVYFVDAKRGWAVGHDGVVLRTDNAGDTWRLQLDGRKVNALLVAAMTRKVEVDPRSETAKKLLAEVTRYAEQGADKPFLDVWFADGSNGFVVGAYNLIFRTVDGGTTWSTWFDRTDNPKFFNLYAIRPVAGDLYIAGESGLIMKLDAAAQRFNALSVPYEGSFFGIADVKQSVLAFGLRGNVLRSDDAGKTWVKVDAGLAASVVAAARTAHDTTLLVDAGGRVVVSEDGGRTFTRIALQRAMAVAGLTEAADGRLALVGQRGVARLNVSTGNARLRDSRSIP
jgi:photosystem II stability/assembly factor-like uncharacterized protein